MKTIVFAHVYGTELQEARHLTEKERHHYNDWCRDSVVIGVGEHVQLPYVTFHDAPDHSHEAVYFNGCGNDSYVISDAEWAAYVALNAERAAAAEAKKTVERVEQLTDIVSRCEHQTTLPTRDEARRLMTEYNNLHNEGGEGYVPYIYSQDEYYDAKRELLYLTNRPEGEQE